MNKKKKKKERNLENENWPDWLGETITEEHMRVLRFKTKLAKQDLGEGSLDIYKLCGWIVWAVESIDDDIKVWNCGILLWWIEWVNWMNKLKVIDNWVIVSIVIVIF
jgi:hypothetical protein